MNVNQRPMTRRDFLIAAGCGCAALALAGSGRLRGDTATAAQFCPYGYRFDPWPGHCYRYVDSNGSGYCDLSETVSPVVNSDTTTTTTQTGSAAPTAEATAANAATSAATTPAKATTSATPAATATATAAAPATPAATATTAAAVELVILCNRGCRYPGHCGRYTDNNGTGVCDLSEGIPSDQAANYVRGGRGG